MKLPYREFGLPPERLDVFALKWAHAASLEQRVGYLEELDRDFPSNRNINFELAKLYRLQHRPDAARDKLRTVYGLEPYHVGARGELALIAISEGDLATATAYIEEAEMKAPNAAPILYARGAPFAK